MKIILVGPSHPYRGGISHYNTRLYNEFIKKGHDCSIVNFKRMYPSIFFPGKTQFDVSDQIFKAPSDRLLDSINPLSYPIHKMSALPTFTSTENYGGVETTLPQPSYSFLPVIIKWKLKETASAPTQLLNF